MAVAFGITLAVVFVILTSYANATRLPKTKKIRSRK